MVLLGVDGGATGTTAVIADENGQVLAVASGGPSNILSAGPAGTRQALAEAVGGAFQKAGYTPADCTSATFGLAAMLNLPDSGPYQDAITPLGLAGDCYLESDVVIAWAAATQGQAGIGLIAGTGSNCFGINAAGERAIALGWDYRLADQGSGYWIGLQGIQASMKIYDGRLPHSPLIDALVKHYELNSAGAMLVYAYQPDFGKEQVASFAREVGRCAAEGDSLAIGILHEAGRELGAAVVAIAQKLGLAGAFPVGLIGGVFRMGDLILGPLRETVRPALPDVALAEARFPAVLGAIIWGKLQSGPVNETFLQTLETSAAAHNLRAKK